LVKNDQEKTKTFTVGNLGQKAGLRKTRLFSKKPNPPVFFVFFKKKTFFFVFLKRNKILFFFQRKQKKTI